METKKQSVDERWAQIESFPDYYVSNLGRVMSKRCSNARILRQSVKAEHGYYYVGLRAPGSKKQVKINVHRLVALYFVDNLFGFETVDHINGIKTDNRACNLRWASASDNIEFYMQKSGHKHKKSFKGWEDGRGWVKS